MKLMVLYKNTPCRLTCICRVWWCFSGRECNVVGRCLVKAESWEQKGSLKNRVLWKFKGSPGPSRVEYTFSCNQENNKELGQPLHAMQIIPSLLKPTLFSISYSWLSFSKIQCNQNFSILPTLYSHFH